jgi:hypothetical protein
MAPFRPWLAVGMRGGMVHVVDAERGIVIATIDGQGMSPEVGWLGNLDGSAPLLVLASRDRMTAYRVTAKSPQ